jgi:hypothetical protein
MKDGLFKWTALAVFLGIASLALFGCTDAEVASSNMKKAADNFEVTRRIVFYNGITGEYMLTIEGLCSQRPHEGRIAIVCKTGPNEYKQHWLGLSHNVTYFSEQVAANKVSIYHYRVVFKPSVLLPSIDVR